MNALNGAVTALFDVLLTPLELVGEEFALIMVSGVFGILALIAFKYISSQKGIKAAKDKIKGHMIEIRLYQDDLVIVAKAIGKVLLRNFQYVAYNFGPFIPLAVPFVFVLAQLVVRYAFVPIPVTPDYQHLLSGQATMISVEMADGHFDDVTALEMTLPEGLAPLKPGKRARIAATGRFYQEIVATAPGAYEIEFKLKGETIVKRLYAGETEARMMQGERVQSLFESSLWPAEEKFGGESAIARITFIYPESNLGWLPMSGPLGVIVVFLVASMAFGFAVLKPLGITI